MSIRRVGVVGYGEVGKIFAAGLRPQVSLLHVNDLKLADPALAAS